MHTNAHLSVLPSPTPSQPHPDPFFSFSFFLSLFLCVQKTTPQQQSSLEYTGKEVDHILPFNVSCSLPASIQCTTFYQSPWSALLKQDFNSLTRFKPFHYLAHRLVIAPLWLSISSSFSDEDYCNVIYKHCHCRWFHTGFCYICI